MAQQLKNNLHGSTSPYLLQHKDNPVHWQLWGDEAFAAARTGGKPILLSIGYAACHWCHVMAHESFENPAIADVMNELFVNIKLDREERPDLDHFYMTALQMMGEQGGWPMTMFLNHEALPFFGGTYFPPEPRYGRMSFPDILQSVAQAFRNEAQAIGDYSEKIRAHLQDRSAMRNAESAPDLLDDIQAASVGDTVLPLLRNIWDKHGGGMSGAPKFPQAPLLMLLSHIADETPPTDDDTAATLLDSTLTRMGNGGIYDHIGGGFARYSVDERWFVPHFEKMLYDNALLLSAYTEAWRRAQNPLFAARAHETIAWLRRDMLLPEGAFAASLDADSEGKEGLYYLWQKAQVQEILDDKAEDFCALYNITDEGNWREHGAGYNIPHLMQSDGAAEKKWEQAREKLLQARFKKIAPACDDKILCDWNAYLIQALARASVVFDRRDYFDCAVQAFAYISDNMRRTEAEREGVAEDGLLYHCARRGTPAHAAMLSDYAACISAGCELLSAVGFFTNAILPKDILTDMQAWGQIIRRHFWDGQVGDFYMSAGRTEDSPVRMSEWQDNAMPSASGQACLALAELFHLGADSESYDIVLVCLQNYAPFMQKSGFATASMLRALHILHGRKQLLVTSPPPSALAELRALSAHRWRVFIAAEHSVNYLPEYMRAAYRADEKKSLYRICDRGQCLSPDKKLSASDN